MEELYKKTLDRLKAELKKQLPEIEANGDWLWHHPEAGFKETETQKYCLEVLKNHGFEACTWPDVTGFTCTYDTGRPGPCVMIMGEMDSLICYSHPDCNPETGGHSHGGVHHSHRERRIREFRRKGHVSRCSCGGMPGDRVENPGNPKGAAPLPLRQSGTAVPGRI